MACEQALWPCPDNIRALSTTRLSGVSLPPYEANNLALHVGDDSAHVTHNRHALKHSLHLPGEPVWLEQTHSTHCIKVEENASREADAAITASTKHPLVVLTADCLPITLCSRQGDEIAAIHGGWRGLLHGIIENTLTKMHNKPEDLMAWIGPAICGRCYAVGEEVYRAFTDKYPATNVAFLPGVSSQGKGAYFADLPLIAQTLLGLLGVSAVYPSRVCTYESSAFYSFRKASITGRIATLIWFTNH